MSNHTTVQVPGGSVVRADLFAEKAEFPAFASAILDPPYGGRIVSEGWDNVSGATLSTRLVALGAQLQRAALLGAHMWIWGGIGTPGERALYRTLVGQRILVEHKPRRPKWHTVLKVGWSWVYYGEACQILGRCDVSGAGDGTRIIANRKVL